MKQEGDTLYWTSAGPVLHASGGCTLARKAAAVPSVPPPRMARAMIAVAAASSTGIGGAVATFAAIADELSGSIQRTSGIFPESATVAATRAICSGVAITCPWP